MWNHRSVQCNTPLSWVVAFANSSVRATTMPTSLSATTLPPAAPSIVILRGDEVIYVESGHAMVQKRNEQDVNEVLEMIKVALRQ